MSTPKATAQKQSDGSYIVRVFNKFDRSTDIVFPYDPQTEVLALEYMNFKNAQAESGPESPATQAVVREFKQEFPEVKPVVVKEEVKPVAVKAMSPSSPSRQIRSRL
jgi:hypothetical protein